jgi:hypothetical protein
MEMESSLGRARFRGTVSLSFRDLGNADVLSQIFLENERGEMALAEIVGGENRLLLTV